MTTEEDKAREEAEARRRRILDAAEDRMKVVDGSAGTPEDSSKTTTSSKLAAMRRRRYGNKGKKQAATAEPTEETTEPAAAASTEEATEAAAAAPTEEATEAAAAAPTEEATKAAAAPAAPTEEATTEAAPQVEAKEAATAAVAEPAETTSTASTPKEEASGEKKHKYMGVARMKRKRLKEKLDAKEAEGSKAATIVQKPKKKRTTLYTLPILMHAVTVLLLFVAGFEIGLQQRHDYGDSLDVHRKLAPQQHGLKIFQGVQSTKEKIDKTLDKIFSKFSGSKASPVIQKEIQDEFADTTEDTDIETERNIDPLFGVDLDELTKGSGPLMFMGRFAVKVHRLNLAVFYYLPRRIVNAVWQLVKTLLDQPPIMCLSALVIRQLIGKNILGASLPAPIEDGKERKDVMSMIKNMVSAFMAKGFPNAVSIYDAWSHLRSDMYVVLCGLFVALAWHHSDTTSPPGEAIQAEPVPGSVSDEL